MRTAAVFLSILATLLCGCDTDQGSLAPDPAFDIAAEGVGRDAFEWSEPVWLGPVVNSPASDWRPSLSPDQRSLYFHSNRGDGLGGFDIWVSHRAGPNCPWEQPVNPGAPLNSARGDGDAAFTPDGHFVFYGSEGHGSTGFGDIFVSHRSDPHDDFAWEEPVNLGPNVNTAEAHESNPWYVAAEGGGTLYFVRAVGGIQANADIYRVPVTRSGETQGPATLVTELSGPPPMSDQAMTVRGDGRELFFWSGTRPGGLGLADLWVSHRQSPNDPWSPPSNVGRPVNSEGTELSATLSHDGRTLFLTIGFQRGGLGLQDLWMSTRGPSSNETGSCPESDD